MKAITQLEFINAVDRAKQRTSIKDSFYLDSALYS